MKLLMPLCTFLILFSCTNSNQYFLNKVESFINDIELRSPCYSEYEWENAEKKFNNYIEKYNRIESTLLQNQSKKMDSLIFCYEIVKFKEDPLTDFNNFIIKVELNAKSYNDEDWTKIEDELNVFIKKYKLIKSSLSIYEVAKLESYISRYKDVRFKDDPLNHLIDEISSESDDLEDSFLTKFLKSLNLD